MKATINEVEIIKGHIAGKGWGRPMQKITTSKGVFIDNRPGFKGPFWRAPDYLTMEGQDPVDDDNIDGAAAGDRGHYQWIRLKKFD